ncbi:hypothetical protein NKV53_09395 [Legionella sp. 27cVA30]|uniref:hypothetical protein n=1 Tax=Legionella sp. 27cVA30 TaxID=2905657 RepID=UPI00209E7B46|nr:hypothetical protein [Legionella sp. 27cVA30]MCP0914552.1 hypothetical protein [Legionella sp. 27cVA30]
MKNHHIIRASKAGTTLPTTYNGVIPTTAYYTVTNNTASPRSGNFVRSLPKNAVQVRSNGTYPDTCGAQFHLAPQGARGDSCTLQLNILGAIDGNDTNPNHLIFVCFPGGLSCAGASPQLNVKLVDPWIPLSVAYEIVYIANAATNPRSFVQTYKDAGPNPVSTDAEWNAFIPPDGYTKNTTRYLQFNEQIFLASPGQPVGSTTYINTAGTPSGYTRGAMSNAINAMWPYDAAQYPDPPSNLGPFEAGNFTTTPPAGVVKVTANYKAQEMKFYANENGVPPGTPGAVPILRFYLIDPWGNEYIMHASAQDNPTDVKAAFDAAILPPGFRKVSRYLKKDFILRPATGPDNAFEYNLLRDNENNTYHQRKWNAKEITITSRIQRSGMPIWGGKLGNTLKITRSFDNTIYGDGGKNVFIFPTTLTAGLNTIADFNVDGDKLDFQGQIYTPIVLPSGIRVDLENGASVLLSRIFYFDDTWVIT